LKKYHQLTEYQRYQLAALRKEGHRQQTMAANLGVHPSTISRELRRNQGQRGYRPLQAHQKAQQRRQQAAEAVKMTPAVIAQVEEKLQQEWSPEQIAGWLPHHGRIELSPERIYQHIRSDRQAGGTLYTCNHPLKKGHTKIEFSCVCYRQRRLTDEENTLQ
jgi:transposase, IS30 family